MSFLFCFFLFFCVCVCVCHEIDVSYIFDSSFNLFFPLINHAALWLLLTPSFSLLDVVVKSVRWTSNHIPALFFSIFLSTLSFWFFLHFFPCHVDYSFAVVFVYAKLFFSLSSRWSSCARTSLTHFVLFVWLVEFRLQRERALLRAAESHPAEKPADHQQQPHRVPAAAAVPATPVPALDPSEVPWPTTIWIKQK